MKGQKLGLSVLGRLQTSRGKGQNDLSINRLEWRCECEIILSIGKY